MTTTILHRGYRVAKVTDDKWIVIGWHGHTGYLTPDAAVRSIDRMLDRKEPAR